VENYLTFDLDGEDKKRRYKPNENLIKPSMIPIGLNGILVRTIPIIAMMEQVAPSKSIALPCT